MYKYVPYSSGPYPLDRFRQTHVVRLKLIQANCHRRRRRAQTPPEELSCLGQPLVGYIIDDARLEADMGVYNNGAAEKGVNDGIG